MKAIIYRRVSREDKVNGKQGLARQQQQIDGYLKHNPQIQIVANIAVDGISGTVIDENQKLMELLSQLHTVDAVIVSEIDRLIRPKNFVSLSILDNFKKTNTLLITPTQTFDLSNPNNLLQLTILAGFAGFEYSLIKERMMEGRANSLSKGNKFAPHDPRGWKWDKEKKKYVLTDEATKIRQGVKMYIQGYSIRAIEKKLGYTRSFWFNKFKDKKLIGINIVKYKGNEYKIETEPMLDQKTWELLQLRLADASKKYAKLAVKDFKSAMLSALLFDTEGNVWYSKKYTAHSKNKTFLRSYYQCKKNTKNIKTEVVEKAFFRYLKEKQQKLFNKLTHEYLLTQTIEDINTQKKELANIEKQIKTLQTKIDKVGDLYVNGIYTIEQTKKAKIDMEKQIITLTENKNRIETTLQNYVLYDVAALYSIHNYLKYIQNYDEDKRRKLTRKYINKVIFERISPTEVNIIKVELRSPREIELTDDDIMDFINEIGMSNKINKLLDEYKNKKDKMIETLSNLVI